MFKAQREDGRAQWRVVYDLMVKMEPGDVLEYGEIMAVVGTEDRHVGQAAAREAAKRLRRNDHRTIRCIRDVGYRMLYANEHDEQARWHMEAGRRDFWRSHAVLKATRTEELTADERRAHEAEVNALAMLQMQIDHLDERVRRMEDRTR